jgi:hypothetical protein
MLLRILTMPWSSTSYVKGTMDSGLLLQASLMTTFTIYTNVAAKTRVGLPSGNLIIQYSIDLSGI